MHLSEILALHGIEASHEAVRHRRGTRLGFGASWCVDETYLKVRSRWTYLYRTIDRDGNLMDTMLSEHRDLRAAKTVFCSARTPRVLSTPGDDGRSWLPPERDPQHTRRDAPAPNQCLPE